MPPSTRTRPPLDPTLKMAVEFGPAVVFFLAYTIWGLYWATGVIMVASVVALGLSWLLQRRIAIMPLVTTGMAVVFGGLTLFLHDQTFIMVKPTVINAMFGVVLLGGLFLFDKPLLSVLFGEVFRLDAAGWRKLTFRWGLFFLALAVANEFAWRTLSEPTWVKYKVFGQSILTFLFTMTQVPMILRHEIKDGDEDGTPAA